MPSRNGTPEDLQQRIDQNSRAQERIDTNPEEALLVLEPVTTVTPAAEELTLRDMFGLFQQLQQQQAAMQAQLINLLTGQSKSGQMERIQAHSHEEIAQAAEQQRATLEAWHTEPRVPVFIQPAPEEQKVFALMGEFPPRVLNINGLEFPLKVGTIVQVPESIGAMLDWARTYTGNKRRPAQPINQITDPERGQFLAGSQSISAGRQGHIGDGPLLLSPVAASPAQAGPLDVRYDHEGR